MPRIAVTKLASVVDGSLHGHKDRCVEHFEIDSRNINRDSSVMFIAIKGQRHDGHRFLHELLDHGVRMFLVEEDTPALKKHPDASYILVDDTILAFQKAAAWYRSQLQMPLIGITGSNGKTVVKEWLSHCLTLKGNVSRSPKSYNSQVGVPLSVWLIQPDADWSVIEAGISLPGEMSRLEQVISPDYGIFTNIGPAHQENFESTEQKIREKLILFKQTKTLYYCRDHHMIDKELGSMNRSGQAVCWSRKHRDCFLYISHIDKTDRGTNIKIHYAGHEEQLHIPFTDDASTENCLHILCFLLHQHFTMREIRQGFATLLPIAMRLEQVEGQGNCTLINDSYNSDLHSLRIALDYLTTQKQHEKHSLILSDIRQSGLTEEKLYKEVFKLTGRYPLHQMILVGHEIKRSGHIPQKALWYPTTQDLIHDLPKIDLDDQTILIKGARAFGFEDVVTALSRKKHTTVLEINLNHLIHNLNYFRDLLKPDTRIMVMVKALTYGSGSYEIANLLQHQKVDYLGVAYTDEGVELRQAGITLPIMVMAPSEESYHELLEYRLEPVIFSMQGLRGFSNIVISKQLDQYPIHIELDTGMHRLGFMPHEMEELANELHRDHGVHVNGVFSHLAVSDKPEEDEFTREQIRLFREMADKLNTTLGYHPIQHILNSAGIERFPEAHLDMVRLGIGLHGISAVNRPLKSVAALRTRIVQIKKIPGTDTVGYNRHGILDRDSEIAVLPVGYADGLDRKLGNRKGQVICQGRKVPFIGDICMDLSMIDITGLDARIGNEVIIFGEGNPISRLAQQVDTIPYEILTGVSTRVKRVYINS